MKKLFFLTVLVSLSFSSNLFSAAKAFVGRSLFNSTKKLDFSSPAVKRHLLDGIKEHAESKPVYALTIKAGEKASIHLPEISNWKTKTEQGKLDLLDIDGILTYDKKNKNCYKCYWLVTFYAKPVKEITTIKVQIKYFDFIHTFEQCVDCVITIVP